MATDGRPGAAPAKDGGRQSGLQTLLETAGDPEAHAPHLHHLALQISHNLRHQHLWTDLRVHATSPLTSRPLPRPLISGLPPQRLYIHPDEQIALLQAQKAAGGSGMGTVLAEREWVCPSHLREKWTLRRFGDVFDAIGIVPPGTADGDGDVVRAEADAEANPWRTKKRVMLGTLDDDSTIVYYIVHDGIVKPRQN